MYLTFALHNAFRRVVFRISILGLRIFGSRVSLLRSMSYGWNNCGWSADIDVLKETCRLAQFAQSHILECGSGLTTILLDIFARVPVATFEHQAEWGARVQKLLRKNRITVAPLKRFEGFDWYCADIPNGVDLVICDGPPSATRGGRYGLYPVCSDKFSPTCLILMDDMDREDERTIVARWQSEFGCAVVKDGDYAVLRHTSNRTIGFGSGGRQDNDLVQREQIAIGMSN
ncbi:MAG TPA: hypothetical protein VN577_15985 [Terriglobales bacterium]|nr:hypothetical protein [Terriglobales bacterium]